MKLDIEARYLLARPTKQELRPGAMSSHSKDYHYRFLFVRGAHRLHTAGSQEDEQSATPMVYLVPLDEPVCVQAGAEGAELIELSFVAHTSLCGAICPQRRTQARVRSREHSSTSTHYRPRRTGAHTVGRLTLSPVLQTWLDGLCHLMAFSDIPYRYYDNKLEEFFYLVGQDPQAEAEDFLAHYHCRISGFREVVMKAYRPDMDVSALYESASLLGLSETAFKRSFQEEFGMPPREWLMERRARQIYQDLISTDKHLKELSLDYGFCNVSYFGAFCRQMLGDTPRRIRKRVQG